MFGIGTKPLFKGEKCTDQIFPVTFGIADNNELTVNLSPASFAEAWTLWTNHSKLVQAFQDYFERVWSTIPDSKTARFAAIETRDLR